MATSGIGTPSQRGALAIRPSDVIWLLLYAALALAGPVRSDAETQVLVGLAALQLVEPRVAWFSTHSGTLCAVLIKLFLAWLLIGVTGGISSSYYLILMVPVVSAATTLGAVGTAAASIVAGASYLSFLIFVDWNSHSIPPAEVRELALRVLLMGILAMLIHQLAVASRAQARQYKETADQLAKANDSLQAAEAAVRRSERLAALGQLTAGLAHELRNPLGTMRASADVLLRSLEPGQAVPREVAGYIREEVDRTSALVTRFLDFARPLEIARSATADWNETIDRAISRLERHQPPLPVSVSVVRNYAPDIPAFPFDPDLMERVFFNLLLNAAQATPPDSALATITVKTRAAADHAEASFIDRGVGIDPSHRESIFNPFFTTKPAGTGLGLAIVAKIVGEHGGRISVESQPGEGSVFRVVLPLTPNQANPSK